MTVLVALILFFRTPDSAWLVAVLKYGLAFMVGFCSFGLLLVSLALIGVRRRKARERRKPEKYVSRVKGIFDYTAELSPATKRFQRLLREIGHETTKMGKRAGRIATQASLFSFSPALRRRAASKGAAVLNRHCRRIETAARELVQARDVMLEVSEGLLKFSNPASEGNKPQLLALQDALAELDSGAAEIIQGQENMRDVAKTAYGQVSMDVHTSLNWIIAVSEENIRIIQGLREEIAQRLAPVLLQKLRS